MNLGALMGSAAASKRQSATDPNFASVVQLAHLDGADGSNVFTNSCPRGDTLVQFGGGAAVLSTAQSVFGGASIRCNGGSTAAYSVAGHADYAFGSGDFTIEFWLRLDNAASTKNVLAWSDGGTSALYTISNSIIAYSLAAGGTMMQTAAALVNNTWHFVSYSRASGVGYLSLDGGGVTAADTNNYSGTALYLGGTSSSAVPMVGYIDDFRVTKGVGRYTNVVRAVPTAAFPNS